MKSISLAHKLSLYLKQKHGVADLNLLEVRDMIELHQQGAEEQAKEAAQRTITENAHTLSTDTLTSLKTA